MVEMNSMKILSIVVVKMWGLHQLDLKTFMYCDLCEYIHMDIPPRPANTSQAKYVN